MLLFLDILGVNGGWEVCKGGQRNEKGILLDNTNKSVVPYVGICLLTRKVLLLSETQSNIRNKKNQST
jgi:hypothetical protein